MIDYEKQKQNKIKKAQLEAYYDVKVDKKKCKKCGKVQTFDEVFSNKSTCEDCGVIYSIPTKFDAKRLESRNMQSTKHREKTIDRIKAERQNSIESSEFHSRSSKGKKDSIVNKKRMLTKEEEKMFIKRMSSSLRKEDHQKRKHSANGSMSKSLNRKRISREETELFFERMVKSESQKQFKIQRARMKALYNAKIDKKRCSNCKNEQSFEEFEANQNICSNDRCQKSDGKSKGFEYTNAKKFDINEFENILRNIMIANIKIL